MSELTEPVGCAECHRAVDEFTAISEKWGYWSDGVGELMPFCPEVRETRVRACRSCFRVIAHTVGQR